MNTHTTLQREKAPHDVLIIGAGPAGTTTASHLAAKGFDVLLLDRMVFPREKVCGDGLIADSMACLERLGLRDTVLQQAYAVKKLHIRSRSGREVCLNSAFWTIKRIILDDLLLRHALRSGAQFLTQAVDTVRYDADGLFCAFAEHDGQRTEFKARYGLIATGTSSIRHDRIGIMPVKADSAMALRCYVTSDAYLDSLEGSFEKNMAPGYAWIFPLAGNEYNVGCIHFFNRSGRVRRNLRTAFETFRQTHPAARKLFAHARVVTPLRAHPLRCGRCVAKVTDNIATLLAGETIGTTYPFTGEGIGKAMETGEIAAQVLQEALLKKNSAPLRTYPALLAGRFRDTYEGYAKAQRWLFRKGFNDIVTSQTARSARLREQIDLMLQEELKPSVVLTAGNIVRSLFS